MGIQSMVNRNVQNGVPAGTFSIWENGASENDYGPAINPTANLDRIGLHSALDYIGISSSLTPSTISRPAQVLSTPLATSITLGAHGQSAPPMLVARFSLNGGTNWNTINGTTFTNIQSALRGRSFVIQADNTNVYVYFNELGTLPAQDIDLEIYILERTFQQARPDNGIIFHAERGTDSHIQAAGGTFDTRRQYLQSPATGQSADIFHRSGPTYLLATGDEALEIQMGVSNSAFHFNLPMSTFWSTTWPPYVTTVNPVQLAINGPNTQSQSITFSAGRVRMSNAANEDVFDSDRQILTFIDDVQYTGVSIPSRPVVTDDPIHEVIHRTWTPSITPDILFGWIRITGSDLNVLTNTPIDFSSTIIVQGGFQVNLSNLLVYKLSNIFPRINGGNVEIVENYYCRNAAGTGAITPLAAYTVDIHLFACALTGGSL